MRKLLIAICSLLLAWPGAATASELEARKAQMDEVHQHILARDFAWLDRTERGLRVERSRTATGVWKLEIFYNAMWYLGQRSSAPDCADSAEPFLAAWRKASPRSPAPFIASADRLLDTAWCFRGSGMAESVDETAWEPFHRNVDAAYEMLVRHKEVASVDPHYYAVMVSVYVARQQSADAFRALVAQAAKREPYYYPFYSEAFRYVEPQWNGSYAEEQALASLAVAKTRAKDRTSALARIYWHQMSCGCLPPAEALDLGALRQSMRDLVELYPDPWNVSHMARLACEIGDADLANHYFTALPDGDDGRSGWADLESDGTSRWQACRAIAGL